MMQIFETFSELAEALQGNDNARDQRRGDEKTSSPQGDASNKAEPRREDETLLERISDLLGE